MIDRDHELALTRQAKILKLSRSGLYYRPRPVPPADLVIMRRIDELHLDYPFAGSRMLRDLLRAEDVAIGRQRVTTMMKRMGIAALYRRPNTSKPAPGHKVYPYLLHCVAVNRPNQVWAMTQRSERKARLLEQMEFQLEELEATASEDELTVIGPAILPDYGL
jgi:putative transposase